MFHIRSNRYTELAGWYGMFALITAYALVSFRVIQGTGLVYQLLNISAGVGLIIVALAKNVPQSVLLNVFWVIIGLVAIARILG